MQKPYIQHKGKVIKTNNKFKYLMAITLNPEANYKEGILRCITNREGNLAIKGTIDRSELHKVFGDSLEHFEIKERLNIRNESEIIKKLTYPDGDFIGLEDPDIWADEETKLIHVYFTIPIRPGPIDADEYNKIKIHLGHAVGKDLDSLEMTEPVLLDTAKRVHAKEVSIAPLNSKGFRYNLIESRDRRNNITYSIIKIAIVKDMGKLWEYGKTVFHPAEHNLSWIAGHASPGPLFSKNFINVGAGKLLGLINGCEANKIIEGKINYGTFAVGLFVYDYENGNIDWVSSKPFIQDSDAGNSGDRRAITFASQFVETKPGEGILYAHVDDSFVRAYTLNAEAIRSLLPKN